MNASSRLAIRIVNAALGAGLLLLAGAAVYVYSRSAFYPAGWVTKYYVLLAVAAAAIGVSYRLPQERKLQVVLLGVSTIVALYVVEIGLFLATPYVSRDELIAIAHDQGVDFDTRGKLEVIDELAREGIPAQPSVHPELFLGSDGLPDSLGYLHPLGGVANATVVYCNETGSYSIYRNDKHGFNNPAGVWETDSVDAVVVGDSFAQGACVAQHETVAAGLRARGLAAVSVGADGSGPLLELAALTEYGSHLAPRWIVWMYFEGNDLFNLAAELDVPGLARYRDDGYSQNLVGRQDEIDSRLTRFATRVVRQETARSRFRIPLVVKFHHLRMRFGVDATAPVGELRTILETAKRRAAAWAGRVMFVYVPDWNRYALDSDDGSMYDRDEVLRTVEELGLPLVDFQAVLASRDDPRSLYPFRQNNHFSAEGYALLAEEVRRRIDVEEGAER